METTAPKPFVFVLMPFSTEFDDVYKLGIKPACDNAGAYAERVDEQLFHESILQRIYNQISKADVIVADMTGQNPNVFYETGYAHALGKPVVLITKTIKDIPFDLQHYQHIVYEGRIANLIQPLSSRVLFAIAQPKEATRKAPISIYVDRVPLSQNNPIYFETDRSEISRISLKFDFHCIAIQTKAIAFNTGVLCSDDVQNILDNNKRPLQQYKQPDNKLILHQKSDLDTIFPNSWNSASLHFDFYPFKLKKPGDIVEMTFNIYTSEGPIEYPFKIEIKSIRQ